MEQLRRLTKAVTDSRNANDENQMKQALKNYDEAIEKYIPVLTGQAKLYWDMENFPLVEKILNSGVETAVEHEIWKLDIAHTFFMQNRFSEAIKYYTPIVTKYQENVSTVH